MTQIPVVTPPQDLDALSKEYERKKSLQERENLIQKLLTDNAILRRDMRIVYKELVRTKNVDDPELLIENLKAINYLIRMLKQR